MPNCFLNKTQVKKKHDDEDKAQLNIYIYSNNSRRNHIRKRGKKIKFQTN
jgi:hypothetical protein